MTKKKSIITLTTDFGTSDGYVGIVKGVIAGICESAELIDLSHDVPAWNISAGSWIIGNSFRYFPTGTIHLAVVDPGVGSKRRAIAIAAHNQYFIGPDNGLFSDILSLGSTLDLKVYELDVDKYWRKEVSTTFHARDLFAPVAAHLANGVALADLGSKLDPADLVRLPLREVKVKNNRVEGAVVYVDRFGNLITNIGKEHVKNAALCQIGKKAIGRIGSTYSSGETGMPVAFVGSHGYLEIAVSQGRANERLDADLHTPVILFEAAQ